MKPPRWTVLALVVVVLTPIAYWLGYQQPKPVLQRTQAEDSLSLWLEPALDPSIATSAQAFASSKGDKLMMASSQSAADMAITAQPLQPDSQPIAYNHTGQPASLTSEQIVQPKTTPVRYLTDLTGRAGWSQELATHLTTAAEPASWSLMAIGDIIIGRTVYVKMRGYGDYTRPFQVWADRLKAADLTVGNLENAFSDARAIITTEGMSFVSPTNAMAGLKLAGIDALNLSNNHSYNGGQPAFLDTLAALEQHGIPYFGGGRNFGQAHRPHITDVKGTKVALLGYSSIVGTVNAGPNTPGHAYLSMAPWGPWQEAYVAQMEADIKAAKQQADVVLVYYHWGAEYTHRANDHQRRVAHRAIDAGASLILGTHPHWVQGVEWYNGKLITYSLGNFVFDQEWSLKTKQGTLLSAKFVGAKLVEASLLPYQIEDYHQPRDVTAKLASQVLGDVFAHSWWPSD